MIRNTVSSHKYGHGPPFSSTHALPDIYGTAFHRWKSARARLAHAVQEYVEACTYLNDVCLVPPLQLSSHRSLEQALTGIDLELPTLSSDEERLRGSRKALETTRNLYQTTAPINTLPSEILAMIFTLASSKPLNSKFYSKRPTDLLSPCIFLRVCTFWRHISLACHALWAHLDLVVGGPNGIHYKRAELWAIRSGDVLLHVDVCEYQDERNLFDNSRATEVDLSRLTSFLVPLLRRVYELEILVHTTSQQLVCSILTSWIKHGTTGSAKMLKIWHSENLETLQLGGTYASKIDEQVTSSDFEAFFHSLRTFASQNSFIPWNSALYGGLVELRLDMTLGEAWLPTQSQLAGVLAASPRLRSLMLINMRIRPNANSRPERVLLEDLQVLSLESSTASSDFRFVYPLLATGSYPISMSITLDKDPGFIAAARSFFQRSNVGKLHVDALGENLSLAPLLGPIPQLQTLAFRHCCLSNHAFLASAARNGDARRASPWPRINNLYLVACHIQVPSYLQQLVTLHSIQTLRVVRGYIETDIGAVHERWKDLEQFLYENIPDVMCSDNWADNPARRWDFVNL